ncbi:MAG TPA: hypothetical protein VIC02_03840 [Kineobactrum sp.]
MTRLLDTATALALFALALGILTLHTGCTRPEPEPEPRWTVEEAAIAACAWHCEATPYHLIPEGCDCE